MVYVLHFKEEPIKWQEFSQKCQLSIEMDINPVINLHSPNLSDEDDIGASKSEILSIIKKTGNSRKGLRVTFNDKKLVSFKSSPFFGRKCLSASKIINKNSKIKPKSVLVIKKDSEIMAADSINCEMETQDFHIKSDALLNGDIETDEINSKSLQHNSISSQALVKENDNMSLPLENLSPKLEDKECTVDLSPHSSLSESESESSQDTIILMTTEESKNNQQKIEESLAKYNISKSKKIPLFSKLATSNDSSENRTNFRKELLKPLVKRDIRNKQTKKEIKTKEPSLEERLRLLTLDLDLDYQINYQLDTPQESLSESSTPSLNGEVNLLNYPESFQVEHSHSFSESRQVPLQHNPYCQAAHGFSTPYSNLEEDKIISSSQKWKHNKLDTYPENYQWNHNKGNLKSPDLTRYQNSKAVDPAALVYEWYRSKSGLNSSKSQTRNRIDTPVPNSNHIQPSLHRDHDWYQEESNNYDGSQSHESHQRRSESCDSFLDQQSLVRFNPRFQAHNKSISFPLSTSAEDLRESDELETFVKHGCDRIERIRKRYSCDYEEEGWFSRRPSIRGIRPRFGSTNEILKQLQDQSRPPSYAEHDHQNVQCAWSIEPSSEYHLSALSPQHILLSHPPSAAPKVITRSAQEGTYIQLYFSKANNEPQSDRLPISPPKINNPLSPSKLKTPDNLMVPPFNQFSSTNTSPTRPLPSFQQGKVSMRKPQLDSLPESQENVIYYHMDV